MFENNRVEAESVRDFLKRYYKLGRYHGRGEECAAGLLASHEADFEQYGHDIISRHDSVTGQVVAYFGSAAPSSPLEALEELADLVQDIIDGNYEPDSFTLQPARACIATALMPPVLTGEEAQP